MRARAQKRIWRAGAATLLCLVLPVFLLCHAAAAVGIDVSVPCSLTIEDKYEEMPLPGVPFSIYRVAAISGTGAFDLLPEFAASGETVNGLTEASQWKELAERMEAWAGAQGISALARQETDEAGKTTFTGLEAGLYLVVGESISLGGRIYDSAPFLLSLPHLNATGDDWDYHVTTEPKNEAADEPSGPDEPSDEPDDPDIPDEPGGPDEPHDPDVPDKPGIPQTGQLKWPVPVLTAAGVLLIALGLWMTRRKQEDEDG